MPKVVRWAGYYHPKKSVCAMVSGILSLLTRLGLRYGLREDCTWKPSAAFQFAGFLLPYYF